ncbi:MAG: hypothetical protein E6G25_05015 [Actinobacteria bacterium]|nr:MAG: hypothetical protein E6G25_05015 [Actinomycetota bacterium]
MSPAGHNGIVSRGPVLLIAHCAALDCKHRLPAADRLQRLIGADLTRLLLIALAGDHRMSSRRFAA